MSVSDTEVSTTEQKEFCIGRLSKFPEHKVIPVDVNERRIGVLRKGDEVYAFANRCPHHGGPMCNAVASGTMLPSEPDEYSFAMDGLVVKCPWHAYEFNVQTGESLGNIMRAKLRTYATHVRGGEVFVQFGRRI